jgi:CRP-like cAMP-binding protein
MVMLVQLARRSRRDCNTRTKVDHDPRPGEDAAMSDKARKLKDDAAHLIAKGKLQEALALYTELVKLDKKDLSARQKYADLLAKVGRSVDAVREYQAIAASYAAEGLLLKAIAVGKLLLQVDPSHTQTHQFLAELSTKRRGHGESIEVPGAGPRKSANSIRGVSASAVKAPTTSAPTPQASQVSPGPGVIIPVAPALQVTSTPSAVPGMMPPLPMDAVEDATAVEIIHDADDVLDLEVPKRVSLDSIPLIPLFSELPKDAFLALTERMGLREVTAGDVIIREGAAADAMFVLIQGSVEVSRATEGGRVVLGQLQEGGFFGEMALLSAAPRVASVTALDDVMLFEIPRSLVHEMERQYPSIGDVLRRFHKNRLITNLMRTSPIFAPFAASDKKSIIERFKSRSVDEGTYVLTRERPAEGLYVVLSGRCVVLDDSGGERQLAELRDGDVFGEMSMLWHKQTCASVKAMSPCILLRLAAADFQELIMTHPQMLEALSELAAKRERNNDALADAVDVVF